MNKEQVIQKIASLWLARDTLETQNNSNDFVETATWCIKGALQEAYDQGVQSGYAQGYDEASTQAAPKKRLCATVRIEAANCSVSVQEPLQGIIDVMLIGANGMTEHALDVTVVDDVEYMSALFDTQRVDVFMQLMRMLAAIHNRTMKWDNTLG